MPKLIEVRPERLAINLFDLDRVLPAVREAMGLAKKLRHVPVRIDADRMDETALEFCCPLLTAATLCDVIRDHDRKAGEQHPTRVYIKRAAIWERLPARAVLTVLEGSTLLGTGRVALSPEWFPIKVALAPATRPQPRRV